MSWPADCGTPTDLALDHQLRRARTNKRQRTRTEEPQTPPEGLATGTLLATAAPPLPGPLHHQRPQPRRPPHRRHPPSPHRNPLTPPAKARSRLHPVNGHTQCLQRFGLALGHVRVPEAPGPDRAGHHPARMVREAGVSDHQHQVPVDDRLLVHVEPDGIPRGRQGDLRCQPDMVYGSDAYTHSRRPRQQRRPSQSQVRPGGAWRAGGLHLPVAARSRPVSSGGLSILVEGPIPRDRISIGLGMAGKPIFAKQAQSNVNTTFTPSRSTSSRLRLPCRADPGRVVHQPGRPGLVRPARLLHDGHPRQGQHLASVVDRPGKLLEARAARVPEPMPVS